LTPRVVTAPLHAHPAGRRDDRQPDQSGPAPTYLRYHGLEKAHNHTVAPLIFRDPPTACAGLAQRQDRSSSLRCGRSVLTPVLTRRCLPGGRKPAKPLVDNVLTEPRPFRDDKRAVSMMLVNSVDTVAKRVSTCRSSSRNHAPNDCHSLANRSFSGSRSARWRCWGPRAAGRPRFPWLGQWSRVGQPTGTRYVERPREQPGTSAAKLRLHARIARGTT
jgi:hypothetical protein